MSSNNTDAGMNTRSSQDGGRSRSGQMFGALEASKRAPENDKAAERRQSITDHSKPKGMIGNMWDSWTRGTGSASK